MMVELEAMRGNPPNLEPLQLKAMDVTIRAVRMCYAIVRDIDTEVLETELERIKKESQGSKGKGADDKVHLAPLNDLPNTHRPS